MGFIFVVLLIAFCLGFIGTPSAYAYLDPGTGSIIIQAVIAALLGAAFTVKMYWYKILNFFKGSKENEQEK